MELAIIVYLINLFGNLGDFFLITGILSVIPLGFAAAILADEGEHSMAVSVLKRGSIFVLTLIFLSVLMPSEKISYTMLAAYGVTEVSTNERVQEIAGNSLDLLEQTIKEYTESKESK